MTENKDNSPLILAMLCSAISLVAIPLAFFTPLGSYALIASILLGLIGSAIAHRQKEKRKEVSVCKIVADVVLVVDLLPMIGLIVFLALKG